MTDYKLAYVYAQMANQAYSDSPRSPAGWQLVPSATVKDAATGFAATAFQNVATKEIVIAYRGTDVVNPYVKGNDLGADYAISGYKNWDKQFTQALDYAKKIMDAHPEAAERISVTGHSLGGSLAQVSSQMLGLRGMTFDPGGAENLVKSAEFKSWAERHQLPPQGKGVPRDFDNYIVNKSAVSNLSGDHVGSNPGIAVSGTAERSFWSKLAGSVPLRPQGGLVGAGAAVVSSGYDQLQRHKMERIEKVFEAAARTGHLNQIGMINTDENKVNLSALSDKIHHATGMSGQEQSNLTFYAANKATQDGMRLFDIEQVKVVQLPSGKTILAMENATSGQLATADVNRGVHTPAEHSLLELAQQMGSQQLVQTAPDQGQRHGMTV